jgi:hypothetical protein
MNVLDLDDEDHRWGRQGSVGRRAAGRARPALLFCGPMDIIMFSCGVFRANFKSLDGPIPAMEPILVLVVSFVLMPLLAIYATLMIADAIEWLRSIRLRRRLRPRSPINR